jgi:outer membrane protein assembly factor BamB
VFEAFSGCPPVVYRGSVYVGHASESGLYAVDARDGTARWARETRNSVNEPALGADGRVVASDGDDLLATDERGRELWTYRTGDDRSSHAPPAWGGGHVVYTTSIIGSVVGIDPEFGGSISEWRYVADSGFGTPTVADETVYVPGSDRLHAIDVTTGDGRWTAAAEASRGVATDGDRLYVPTEDGALLALATADGSEQWRATLATDADVYLRTRPCVTARSVVVTTEKPQLDERVVTYGLDRTTGEERWRVEQPGNLGYDAVAAGDRVYVPVGWSTREADSTLVALSG